MEEEATAAVPDEWIDEKSLVGPPARIRERYRAWAESGADALTVRSRQPAAIEVMAEAAGLHGAAQARRAFLPPSRRHAPAPPNSAAA